MTIYLEELHEDELDTIREAYDMEMTVLDNVIILNR